MANEAVLVEFDGFPSDWTVADGTAIAKGAILMATDPRTASLATDGPVAVAGIAAREKVANDGRTNLAVYTSGKFLVYASGAITIGQGVMVATDATTYPNFVSQSGITASGGFSLGRAEETASNGEQILITLGPGTGSGQA